MAAKSYDVGRRPFRAVLSDQRRRIEKLFAEMDERRKAPRPVARGDYAVTIRDHVGSRTMEYEGGIIPSAITRANS